MPIIRETATGSNYLQKTTTTADNPAISALQLYEKQAGSDGATGNTIFTLSNPYVTGSNTLLVFINGQKAERLDTPLNATQYAETNSTTVTFGASLQDADVVEFVVAGSYMLDDNDIDNLKVLAPSPAADHSYDSFRSTITVGEDVVFGNCLYMKSDGKLWESDADASATMPIVGMAMASISADASGVVALQGFVRDDTWNWTIGGLIYGSTTKGGLTQAPPDGSGDIVQIVGWAYSADILYLNPQLLTIEIA